MSINHRSARVAVAEEFLNRADVIAIFQKMGGKGMANVCGVAGFVSPTLRTARSQLSAKLLRGGDVRVFLPLPDLCNGSSRFLSLTT